MKRIFAIIYIAGLFGIFSIFKISGNMSMSTIIFPVLYIYTLFELIKKHFNYIDFLAIKIFLLLFIGLFLTAFFSYNVSKSVISVINLGFNYLFGYWLVITFSKNEILELILKVLVIILYLSIIVLIVKPDLAIYFDPLDRESLLGFSNIKGVFPHKIHAGLYYVLGFVISIYFYKRQRTKKYLYLMICFVIGVLSTGSSLAFSTMVFILFIPKFVRRHVEVFGLRSLLFLISFLTFGITILFYLNVPEILLNALGRDMTLTGRVSIWEFGFGYINENLWVGGGFNTFFDDVKGAPAHALWSKTEYYRAPSFHNGYLEIIAESGILGGLPFLIFFMITLNRTLQQRDYISFSILLLCLIANLAAAVLVKQNMFFFVFLVYIFLYQKFAKNKYGFMQRA